MLGVVPLGSYERPVIKVISLESLDSAVSYAESFEERYDHTKNTTPDPSNLSFWRHTLKPEHNMDIADQDYWIQVIEEMIKDKDCFQGGIVRGNGDDKRMIYVYTKILADKTQLWAYVVKRTQMLSDAGRNLVPWVWQDGIGLVKPQGVDLMALVDLTYEMVLSSVQQGMESLGVPYFDDDDMYTRQGLFVTFGERYTVWKNGGSADPSIFEVYSKIYNSRFGEAAPTAREAYELAKEYLVAYEAEEAYDERWGNKALLSCFEAGVSYETWEAHFNEATRGIVE